MGRRTRREQAEGAPAARHGVLPPPCPEFYRRGERVRGGSAWRSDRSCATGGKADAFLMENSNPRAWLLVPGGATPVPLGWAAGAVCGVTSCGRHAP